jgi:Winged helix DNA-binding domain
MSVRFAGYARGFNAQIVWQEQCMTDDHTGKIAMSSRDIVQQRLHNQHLLGAPFARPEEVVAWFGAVQAQEYPGATWGIAQRMHGLTQAAIDQAYAEGAMLRTHAMRPTWHFVTPGDIRWLLKLTSPRVHAVNAFYYRKLELDFAVLARSANVLTSALQGGKHLTRTELAAALSRRVSSAQARTGCVWPIW